MTVELSTLQVREVKEVLEGHLQELLQEIARADHREFRDQLRERYDRMEALRRKLETVLEELQAYA